MCKILVRMLLFVLVLAVSTVVQAEVFTDNFDTPRDYLIEGVEGTGWDGFLGSDQGATVDKLNVSIDREGQLFMESTGGYWHEPWDPVGPLFYKNIAGDFSVVVRVTEFAGTFEAPLLNNAAGIMVRDPDSDTGEENWVSIAYFPTWTGFIAWDTIDGARSELGQTDGIWNDVDTFAIAEQYPYLQIERVGSEFHLGISSDGVNFLPLTDPAYQGIYDGSQTPLVINRPDLPLTLQIGLFQATYSAETGYVAFDDFSIVGPDVVSADKASLPTPGNRAADVPRDIVLSWKPGIAADSHNVYFGTDPNNVGQASPDDPRDVLVSQNQAQTTYDPGILDYDQTYFWRVDEISDASPDSPSIGNVWSFTTVNYIVVDDFEDYNDYSPYEIWNTWIDGFGDPTNGSTAGYPDPDFNAGEHYVETDVVHSGDQSMPLFYNNSAGLSEVTKTLTEINDWTVDDVIALTMFYYGDAGNSIEQMYVAVNGNAVVTNDNARAVLNTDWTVWNIPLQVLADQGVNLSNVNTLSIGIGDKANPSTGGSGRVFFDDIRLSRSLPDDTGPGLESVDPGTDNLIAYYSFEDSVQDVSGNGNNAVISGNPQYVNGATGYGKALDFDGVNDYVTLPIGSAIGSMTSITVGIWVNFSDEGGEWQRVFDFGSGETVYMFLSPGVGATGVMRFAIRNDDNPESILNAPNRLQTGWHHVAVTIDGTSMEMVLYLDGRAVANGHTLMLPADMGQTTQNWLCKSQFAADAYYDGGIDECRIYDRALSDVEVLYLAGK